LRADSIERELLVDILARAMDFQDKRDDQLAIRIINNLIEALK
jgi:hypothetical protein